MAEIHEMPRLRPRLVRRLETGAEVLALSARKTPSVSDSAQAAAAALGRDLQWLSRALNSAALGAASAAVAHDAIDLVQAEFVGALEAFDRLTRGV